MAKALRAKIYRKLAISLRRSHFDPKFRWTMDNSQTDSGQRNNWWTAGWITGSKSHRL